MPEYSCQCLQANLRWLAQVGPALANQLCAEVFDSVALQPRLGDADCDLFFRQELVLEACGQSLSDLLEQQLKRTDGVAMPRPMRIPSVSPSSPSEILAEMVNLHREALLDHLPAVSVSESDLRPAKPPYRNLVIFGSLMLVPLLPLLQRLETSPWISLTLVEDDLCQLVAMLSILDLPALVDLCKRRGIRLTLHVDECKVNLQDRLFTQLSSKDPTLLYGWQTLRSPVRSPALMELHSWLHAPEGAAQYVLGMLGFATDEINQTQQALWNALAHKPMRVLASDRLETATPCVLVASGPSLTSHFPWLRQHQNSLNLVAAGSALGSLLRAGIRPAAAVFLERDAGVYSDLCDLLAEGYNLEGVTALVSSTIDPRVPVLFPNSAFFHRPVAAATGLFPDDQQATMPVCGPHVINAALEALICLGSRELLLVGADFAAVQRDCPRADGALGDSPRELIIPVRGNRGRTVFSEPGLLHTGDLLNRVIASIVGCQVLRLGEGAVLDATETVDESHPLAARFGRSPGALAAALQDLPTSSFSPDDCTALFALLEAELHTWGEQLSQSVQNSEGWSRSLAEALAPLLQRLHQGDTRQRRFLAQLLCQPLFFSGMALHDALSGDAEAFALARNDFLASIDLMQSVVCTWLGVMRPWLAASQLPLWDPEWLRTRYRRLDSIKV